MVYRIEMALESVKNRVYALGIVVIVLLVFSIFLVLGVSWLTDDEFHYFTEDAEEEEGDRSFFSTFLWVAWLTWCFFIDPGSHTEKLEASRFKWFRAVAATISLLGIFFFSFADPQNQSKTQ